MLNYWLFSVVVCPKSTHDLVSVCDHGFLSSQTHSPSTSWQLLCCQCVGFLTCCAVWAFCLRGQQQQHTVVVCCEKDREQNRVTQTPRAVLCSSSSLLLTVYVDETVRSCVRCCCWCGANLAVTDRPPVDIWTPHPPTSPFFFLFHCELGTKPVSHYFF